MEVSLEQPENALSPNATTLLLFSNVTLERLAQLRKAFSATVRALPRELPPAKVTWLMTSAKTKYNCTTTRYRAML